MRVLGFDIHRPESAPQQPPASDVRDQVQGGMRGKLVQIAAACCANCGKAIPLVATTWTEPMKATVVIEETAVQTGWVDSAVGWICPTCSAGWRRERVA